VIERHEIGGLSEEEHVIEACEWMEQAVERFRELEGARG
jgi:hypothetical protein